jgi:hypothetical protein
VLICNRFGLKSKKQIEFRTNVFSFSDGEESKNMPLFRDSFILNIITIYNDLLTSNYPKKSKNDAMLSIFPQWKLNLKRPNKMVKTIPGFILPGPFD